MIIRGLARASAVNVAKGIPLTATVAILVISLFSKNL